MVQVLMTDFRGLEMAGPKQTSNLVTGRCLHLTKTYQIVKNKPF